MRRLSRGVTLVELLVGMAIVAILATAAAPFMADVVINSRLREAGNVLFTETLIAQSEAIKRNTTVRVTTAGDTVQVQDMTVPATPVTLRTRTVNANATLPNGNFSFGAEGRPTPFGTAVSINVTGNGVACSADYRCPGLRVDAGGAARLCGNHLASCP